MSVLVLPSTRWLRESLLCIFLSWVKWTVFCDFLSFLPFSVLYMQFLRHMLTQLYKLDLVLYDVRVSIARLPSVGPTLFFNFMLTSFSC